MGVINIEDIRPGMILAESVKDRRGRVLLGEGSGITERHLKILRMWGITEADIQGVEREQVVAQAVAELDASLLQAAEARAQQLFQHTDREHPAIRELFRLCSVRIARDKAVEGNRVS